MNTHWYFAHVADGVARQVWTSWWSGWDTGPLMVTLLVLPLLLYACGTWQIWRRMPLHATMKSTELSCFLAGWLVLVMALMSPLHPLGNELFFAHMIQHELLMVVSAPLLVFGRPQVPMLWGLPRPLRHGLGSILRSGGWRWLSCFFAAPMVAWLSHALVLWLWHVPRLFEAALHSELVHFLQHASFLGTALLFWHAVAYGRHGVTTYGASVLFLFTTALHSGVLGALLTVARTLWYPAYSGTSEKWGLTALEDQQLGGLIMWVPAGLVYLIAGLLLFAAWLRASEKAASAREAPPPNETSLS
jgi:putative membrane protein